MATNQARQETIDAFVEQRVDDDDVELRTKALLAMANGHHDYTVELGDVEGRRMLMITSPEQSPYVNLIDDDHEIPIEMQRIDKDDDAVVQFLD